jgi:hypothetical protein
LVRGPDGQEARHGVTVLQPDWRGTLLTSYAEVIPGGSAKYRISIAGLDGFDGTATFSAESVPTGWSVTLPSLRAGESGDIEVRSAIDAGLGEYVIGIIGSGGKPFSVIAKVVQSAPAPHISSLSKAYGSTGDEIQIIGYGFGADGSARIGSLEMTVLSRGDNLISALIPNTAATGNITVVRDGISSNGIAFVIKNRGFTLRPEETRLALSPGERRDVSLAVTGYADAATLQVLTQAPISASLDKTVVVPNATAKLSLSVDAGAANETYTVSVTGTSRDFTTSVAVTIVVGDAFQIVTESLPSGMSDVEYTTQLQAKNASGEVVFSIADGELPSGLSLSASGEVYGRPIETGEKALTIRAQDASGHADRKNYTLRIEENAWAQSDKDGGRTRYNPTGSPADSRKKWTSAPITGAREILTGAERVFVMAGDGIRCLERESGGVLYRIPGSHSWFAYSGGRLYALKSSGGLSAIDPNTGNELWAREEVTSVTTDGDTILAETPEALLKLDARDGSLLSTLASRMLSPNSAIWRKGKAYEIRGRALVELTDAAKTVHEELSGSVVCAAADENGFALLTEGGEIVLLNGNYVEMERRAIGIFAPAGVSLSESAIIVADGSGTREFARQTLEQSWARGERGAVATGKEKAFVSGQSGVVAVNRYDGSQIWTVEGERKAIALAGEKLFLATSDGRIECYNAPNNIFPPDTVIVLQPDTPDGTDGWYRIRPEMKVQSTDRETYVSKTMMKVGAGEWKRYEGAEILAEGDYSVQAYGVDSDSYRGETASLRVRSDETAPESVMIRTQNYGQNGWSLGAVTVTLSATDAVSGVDRIDVTKDSGSAQWYTNPLDFTEEGAHSLRWNAVDKAGNTEAERTESILIDLFDPTVSATQRSEKGITLVTLEATDSGSGIERVEYMLDSGAAVSYQNPIALTERGTHEILYRALDKAGRSSAWKKTTAIVRPGGGGKNDLIAWLEVGAARQERDIIKAHGEHSPIYAGLPKNAANTIKALPRYLEGSQYILLEVNDRGETVEPFARFWLKSDALVYVAKNALSNADMAGWTRLEQGYPIAGVNYFPGGADIYMKRYPGGSMVEIPALKGQPGSYANLIFVDESRKVTVKILSPIASHTYRSNQAIPLLALSIPQEGGLRDPEWFKAVWSVKDGTGEKPLDSLIYRAPAVNTEISLSFYARIVEPDGKIMGEDSVTIKVKKFAAVTLFRQNSTFGPWTWAAGMIGRGIRDETGPLERRM